MDVPAPSSEISKDVKCLTNEPSNPDNIGVYLNDLQRQIHLLVQTLFQDGPKQIIQSESSSILSEVVQEDPLSEYCEKSDFIPGRYRVLRILAEGGCASIYRAEAVHTNQLVALKVIKSDDRLAKRFRREFEILSCLQHENIARPLEIFTHGPLIIFSMELLEDGAESMKFPLLRNYRDVAKLFAVLARTMQYVHTQGIVHRDIKPENILFVNGSPKIIDFGLAVTLEEEVHVLAPCTGLGSVHYVSPEQANGHTIIDASTDIYSLGAVLYECLVGRPRLHEVEWEDADAVLQQSKPIAPSILMSNTPLILNDICMKCLEIDKVNRYKTAEELALDLEQFLESHH